MNNICVYCGAEAKFQFKNGKWCCSDSKNKCPINRKKVSEFSLREWASLKNNGIKHKKEKCKELRKQNKPSDICSYGCNKPTKYILPNGRSCCSERYYLCEAVKHKRSEKLKSIYSNKEFNPKKGKPAWNKGLTKQTDKRVLSHGDALSKKYKNKEIIPHNLGKMTTDEVKCKISKSRIQYLLEHPDQVPYKLNHSSRISYPEKYFKLLFKIEQIPLQYHKQIGLYELDFYNEDKQKYVEIDGESHYTDKKTIEIDKRRNIFFNSKGWVGIRIRWSLYKKASRDEKQNIIRNIKTFLE